MCFVSVTFTRIKCNKSVISKNNGTRSNFFQFKKPQNILELNKKFGKIDPSQSCIITLKDYEYFIITDSRNFLQQKAYFLATRYCILLQNIKNEVLLYFFFRLQVLT